MNAHTTVDVEASVAEPYRFEKGQPVQHQDGGVRSIVFDRQRSLNGTELYYLYVVPDDARGRPVRLFRGDCLVQRSTTLVGALHDEYCIYRAFVADTDTKRSEEEVEDLCGTFFDVEYELINAPASSYADLMMKINVFKEIVDRRDFQGADCENDDHEAFSLFFREVEMLTDPAMAFRH
ncbi:hypothetical protein ACCS67_15790 [Rhizobium brockwellii]|uniref:hypothetical protein n=1 Tax=Rhizobium brockwellii TaxID=3019932 RepID=UPI003F9590E9